VQLEQPVGRGRLVLLNLAVCKYHTMRWQPANVAPARDLRNRLRAVLERAAVQPWFEVQVQNAPTCVERLVLRRGSELTLVVRLNLLEAESLLAQIAERAAMPVHIRLPAKRRVRDLLRGTDHGAVETIDTTLDPLRGLFLAVDPP
jgi:hypothetical protein